MTEQQAITEFITARLDEDHYRAYQAQGLLGIPTPWWTWRHLRNRFGTSITRADALHIEHHSPARALREVTAKRAILTDHSTSHTVVDGFCTECGRDVDKGHHGGDWCAWHGDHACSTVRHLAAAYSDHEDYNPAWSTE